MSETARELDVLSFGESLVDFLPSTVGLRLRKVDTFRRVAGGGPSNVAVGLARLGSRVGLWSKLGADEFGFFLRDFLEDEGVDTEAVQMTREAKTGITFVSLDAVGERSFMFFREPSADMTLRLADIDASVASRAGVFAFGSNLMVEPPVKEAADAAIEAADQAGCLLVCDPNLRLHLWEDPQEAFDVIHAVLGRSHIAKLADEELEFLAPDCESAAEAYQELLRPAGLDILVHTRGEDGAALYFGDQLVEIPIPESVQVRDTTGAGDGFVAGFLHGLCSAARQSGVDPSAGIEALMPWMQRCSPEQWSAILRLGCLVGSRVCTDYGATPSLPHAASIDPRWLRFGEQ